MAQYNANTSSFLGQSKTLFEVNMLANKNGTNIADTSSAFTINPAMFIGSSASVWSSINFIEAL